MALQLLFKDIFKVLNTAIFKRSTLRKIYIGHRVMFLAYQQNSCERGIQKY